MSEEKVLDDSKYVMAVVINAGLGMSKGKIAAQAAHAAVYAAVRVSRETPEVYAIYIDEGSTKIVLKVPDAVELEKVAVAADVAGLVVEDVHDAGLTQVEDGAFTAIAVFGERGKVKAVTASLKLL